jgi:hypothetical protein
LDDGAISNAAIAPPYRPLAVARADQHHHPIHELFRRPGRGRRALRRAAMAFLRLLTKPPLRPFSRLACRLASLRTSPLVKHFPVPVVKVALLFFR